MSRGMLRGAARAPGGGVALVVVTGLIALAAIAPMVWGGVADDMDLAHLREGASTGHWFGTDELGRDVFARVMVATRTSITMAFIAALSGVLIGVVVGGGSVLLPSRYQRWIANVNHVLLAFPGLLLAMVLATILGVGALGAVIAIAVSVAPFFVRLAHTLAASIAGADFVAAARLAGVGKWRLLNRHVLLNIAEPLIINTSLAISSALLALAGLSFLGLGVQAPAYDWGQMLNASLDRIYVDPIVALAPAGMIVMAGLGFNLLGEALSHSAGGRDSRSRRMVNRQRQAAGVLEAGHSRTDGVRSRTDPIIRVRGLTVTYPSFDGPVRSVRELGLDIGRGEIVGLVGESGSGKSQAALAIAQLIESPGIVTAEEVVFDGIDVLTRPGPTLARRLGLGVAMVFQDPMSSFNPALKMSTQLTEAVRAHTGLSKGEAADRAIERLGQVRISRPHERMLQYPHQLSGGMRQRAMIAMGLMGTPKVIIADEPTTALDVTVQREILRLLLEVNAESDAAVLLISHDVAVVATVSDRVLVMYAGRVVEDVDAAHLVRDAAHPYTRALIDSVPHMTSERDLPLVSIPGRPPAPTESAPGCAYAPRCPIADRVCTERRPGLAPLSSGQLVACWKPMVGLKSSVRTVREGAAS